MMGTKIKISDQLNGSIEAGALTFEIIDPTLALTLKVDGLGAADYLNVVRENYVGDGWEPATSGGREIQLNAGNRTATIIEVGTYSVEGLLSGAQTRTLWTEGMA